jgi:hypothetical protein
VNPLQVKWEGIEGEVLHSWLTDPDNGLKIVISADTSAVGSLTRKVRLAPDRLQQWWDSVITDPSATALSWSGDDVSPLTAGIISAGGVVYADDPSRSVAFTEAIIDAQSLNAKIQSIAGTAVGGSILVGRDSLLGLEWESASTLTLRAPANLKFKLHPGKLLVANPDLTKDLTNSSHAGINALINP